MIEVIINNVHIIDGVDIQTLAQADRAFADMYTYCSMWSFCLKHKLMAQATLFKNAALANLTALTKANMVDNFVITPLFDPSPLNELTFINNNVLHDTPGK
jgi:hypothetical protein